MSYCVVIPARYASVRLPGKLLKSVNGKPLLQYTFEQARRSQAETIYIATDDQRIYDIARGFGADVCMTSRQHSSGTQRIHEVIQQKQLPDDTIIVNLQGDEPLMPAACIDQVAGLLADNPDVDMATLCTPLTQTEEIFDGNAVKVVTDRHQRALYFSRATIPWYREAFKADPIDLQAVPHLRRHIGIYAQRVGFIKTYHAWGESPLEQIELLEQLRVLWHGGTILVADASCVPGPGVDTEEDLARFAASL